MEWYITSLHRLKKNEVRKDVFEQNPSKVLTESEQSPSIIDKIVEVGLLRLSLDFFPWTLLALYSDSLDCLRTPQSPQRICGECKVLLNIALPTVYL